MEKKSIKEICELQLGQFRKIFYESYHMHMVEVCSFTNSTKLTTLIQSISAADVMKAMQSRINLLPEEINEYPALEKVIASLMSDEKFEQYKSDVGTFIEKLKQLHPLLSSAPSYNQLIDIYQFFRKVTLMINNNK